MVSTWRLRSHVKSRAVSRSLQGASGPSVTRGGGGATPSVTGGGPREVGGGPWGSPPLNAGREHPPCLVVGPDQGRRPWDPLANLHRHGQIDKRSSQALPRPSQDPPKTAQETPKTLPRPLRDPTVTSLDTPGPLKESPKAPKTAPGGPTDCLVTCFCIVSGILANFVFLNACL